MIIFIDLTSLTDNLSGIERFASNIALNLISHNETDFILAFKENISPDFNFVINRKNVRIIIIPRCNKLIFYQIRLPLAINKIQADVYLFPAFPVPVLLCKKNMIPFIHDVCCWDCPETMKRGAKWYYRLSYRIASKKCGLYITISDFSKSRIIRHMNIPDDRIKVIYCAADDKFNAKDILPEEREQQIRKKYGLPDNYILSLSTIEPRKNLNMLVDSYNRLVQENKLDIPLVLSGRNGWWNKKFRQIPVLTPNKHIVYTGYIEDADLPYVISCADFFVYPSIYEGFGLPPVEAMACGTPVLSSNADALKEVLGEAAEYFDYNNPVSLDEGLLRMYSLDQAQRRKMIDDGLKRASRYDWGQETNKLYKIITENI